MDGSVRLTFSTNSPQIWSPVSAMSRMVCLKPHTTLSITNLNWPGARSRRAKRNSRSSLVYSNWKHIDDTVTLETLLIDGPEHVVESGAMFGEFGKVLGDHVQSWFKGCFQNERYTRGDQVLDSKQSINTFFEGLGFRTVNLYLRLVWWP